MRLPYAFPAPLRTDRLVLRLMAPGDVDDIHAYQAREDVCRYLPFEPRERDAVAEKVAQYAGASVLSGEGSYWQLAVEHGGRVIGDVYFTIRSAEHRTAEIGWTLHPDLHGQGFMTEAAGAVLALAFREIGLHRVVADLDARNAGSIALCRRLGMREEARFVEHMWFKGEWADTGIYAILEREWAARPPAGGAGRSAR